MKCRQCGKEFVGHGNAKYCADCRKVAQRERDRQSQRRRLEQQRPKTVVKPVEKFRTLTKDDVARLMKLIREAYCAGRLILDFGGQSALTDEQLAVVEQKYPNHSQNLGDLRNQKFLDAVDNFIEAYQPFKRKEKER